MEGPIGHREEGECPQSLGSSPIPPLSRASSGFRRLRRSWRTAPGCLLTYLEAALADALPYVGGTASAAMAAGIPHAEVAGLLAEAVGDEPVALVLDELERLGDDSEAWDVIEALLRYAPPELRA